MRIIVAFFLTGTLLLVPICGCAQTSSQTQVDEQTQTDGKYDGIIADLEEEDYDGAIATITEMKNESLAKAHADMEDYLVTVELTKENFDEYFEWVTAEPTNAFGEKEYIYYGLRSKKYDDGLILYGLDDANYSDSIRIEYSITFHDPDYDRDEQENNKIGNILMLPDGAQYESVTLDSVDRIAGSKLTYVKREFVESYDIEPAEHPEDQEDSFHAYATITLKNGETFERYIARDYPY